MSVQIALDIRKLHESWQSPRARSFDLAAVFAQLRRNFRETDRTIHRSLGIAGDTFRAQENPVLVDLEATVHRDLAQRDAMRLGAGEVDERRP